MPNWSVSTTSGRGHGRMGGDTTPADQRAESDYNLDSRKYHSHGKGTIVPRAGHGFDPKDGLAGIPIIDIEEDEVDVGGSVQIESSSKVYRPGDPNHPFAKKEAQACPSPSTPPSSETRTSPQPPAPSNPTAEPSKTQAELSKLLSETRQQDEGSRPSPSSTEKTAAASETSDSNPGTTPGTSSTESSPPTSTKKKSTRTSTRESTSAKLDRLTRLAALQSQLQQEQMEGLTAAISSLATNLDARLTQATSPDPETQDPEPTPTPSDERERVETAPKLLTIEGQFGILSVEVDQVQTSQVSSGTLLVLVFDPNKPHVIPHQSEDPIRVRWMEGDELRDTLAHSYGLSFPLEVGGARRVVALLRAIEQG